MATATSSTKLPLSDLASTVQNVPLRYIRPISDRPNLTLVEASDASSIPLIDLDDLGHSEIDKLIDFACHGFCFSQAFKRSSSEMTLEGMSSLFGYVPPLSSKEEAKAILRQQSIGREVSGNPPLGRNASAASDTSSEIEKSVSVGKKDSENAPSAKVEVPPDNEFEKHLWPNVIRANKIGVSFADIGGSDEIKKLLMDHVRLSLWIPDRFKRGLLRPCQGILLFGPPGTGKTMLAEAIAKEAGATLINVSMSTITSNSFGEEEKNVRALFTLAGKVSPTIIFVDFVDRMLGYQAMGKIKNEFMAHWNGLTKSGERIIVLAATNKPFYLDEDIIRHFEFRIMVGLPSVENREMILKNLLSKEETEDIYFKELAVITEGYTGSDLENLCVTAARLAAIESNQKEGMMDMERKKREAAGKSSEDASDSKIELRPLNMEDLRQAKNQVGASFCSDGEMMRALKQWNDVYGAKGLSEKEQLPYYM